MEQAKHSKKKRSIIHIVRLIVQVAAFVLLPSLFIDAYDGVKALVSGLLHGNLNLSSEIPQLIVVVSVLPATLLWGRFFCGWMCAFGALGDFIYRISGRFVKFRMNEKLDSALKYVKYVLLAFFIIAGWVFGARLFTTANPWDAFGMLATVGTAPDFSFVLQNLLPAFALLIVIVVGSAFVERFFCRYFCPMGAVFSLLSRVRILKIQKPTAKCGKCRVCTNNCAMGIPLYRNDRVSSGECIQCMKCTAVCPRRNIAVTLAGYDVRPLAVGTVAVAAMTCVYLTGDIASNALTTAAAPVTMVAESNGTTNGTAAAYQPTISSKTSGSKAVVTPKPAPTTTQKPTGLYKDGTYTGSGKGFRGTTTVEVTVQSGQIKDISVVSVRDTPRFFNKAAPKVINEILSAQSPNVDAVSGATYSSMGIMSAVEVALSNAKNQGT